MITPKDLIAYRKRLGLSQGDLAAKLGVSSASVGNWERGTSKMREQIAQRIKEEMFAEQEDADRAKEEVEPFVNGDVDVSTPVSEHKHFTPEKVFWLNAGLKHELVNGILIIRDGMNTVAAIIEL